MTKKHNHINPEELLLYEGEATSIAIYPISNKQRILMTQQ